MNRKKRNMTELGPLSRLPARQLDLPEPGRNSDPDFFLFESRLYGFYVYFLARGTDAVRDVVRTEPAGVRFSDCRTFKRFVS